MNEIADFFIKYNGDNYRYNVTFGYYIISISEFPFESAESEIVMHNNILVIRLSQCAAMNSENGEMQHHILH